MADEFRLADHGRFFATRERGRQIRSLIEALPPGQPVTLDWRSVQAMTGAFADELLGKLIGLREITNANMGDEVRETIETAYRRRREGVGR